MHDSWNESQFSSLTTVNKEKTLSSLQKKTNNQQKSLCATSLSVPLETVDFPSLSSCWRMDRRRGSCLTQAVCSDDAVVL